MGNSHLFPLAKAWRENPGDLEATFLAAPGDELRALAVSDGTLKASGKLQKKMLKISGVAEAAVDEFDAFAIVGLQFTVNRCVRHLAGQFPASRPLLLAAARKDLEETTALHFARELRRETSAPVLVVADAGVSEQVLAADSASTEVWRKIHAQGRESEIRSIYDDACKELPGDFEILGQPAETISHEILTLSRYDGWDPSDGPIGNFHLVHMTIEYGRIVMRNLRRRL